jgi:AcrR family transcriptional regulator
MAEHSIPPLRTVSPAANQPPAAPGGGLIPPQKRTLERLFDTAAGLFWEKGYAATTTREIASALGIQQASLYYHIASKEDLLYQLCVASLEQLRTDVQNAMGEMHDPLGRIRALIRAHLTTILNHQVPHVTMLTELRALSNRHHDEVLALRKSYAGLVRSVLEEAQSEGVLRADIAAKYLYLALLNVLNWAVLWFRRDQELPADRLTGIFTPIYLDGAATAAARLSLTVPELPARRKKSASNARERSDGGQKSTAERMLKTAAALFSRKGYEATSTREIAALLRIQKASLYYHIESKEDLLYTICKSSLEQIRQDVEGALQSVHDPLERMRTLVRAHIESMLRDQDKHSATLSEMRALSKDRLADVIALRDAYEDRVRAVLHEAQKAGALRNDIPVKYLCLHLLGLINRVEIWYRRTGPLAPAQLGEMLALVFLTGAARTAGD